MTRTGRPSRLALAGYALLLVYVVVAFLVRNHQTFMDEGSNLNLAACVLKERHLYRDLFENHFPLPVYWSAALILFAGASLSLVRLGVLIVNTAMILATMRLSRMPFAIGFAAAVWALISPYYFGNMLLYDNIAAMAGLALGSVTYAVLARGIKPSSGMFVFLSFAGVVAVLSSPFFALVALIATGALFFAPQVPRAFVVRLWVVIGVPVAAYAGYLAATGALGAFYADAVTFNATTYQRYLPTPWLPAIGRQLLFFDLFNPEWLKSWDPWKFNPVSFTPVFDYWIFSGFFYRAAALLACGLCILRRNYPAAVFLYLFTAALPLRLGYGFHAAPFVIFCLFLAGTLIEESLSAPKPWALAGMAACLVPSLVLAISGARYVARHALQSDFEGLLTEARSIRETAGPHPDVRLGHYPDGNYMYYLTGLSPLAGFVDFYPWVAAVGRPEVDAELVRAPEVLLVMNLSGNTWTYPNAGTLAPEVAYAQKTLIQRATVPWMTVYVSPSLVSQTGEGNEAALTAVDRPFPDCPAGISGDWKKNGYDPAAGSPPVGGNIFGSFPGSETKAGTLRLGPFPLDRHRELAIPLVTGRHTSGLLLTLRDAVSGKVLVRLDPPPVSPAWILWRPDLPQNQDLSIQLTVEANATARGEWMAVGCPQWLRPAKPQLAYRPGLYRDGRWTLSMKSDDLTPAATKVFHFGGRPGDLPVTGDWTGSGKTRVGIYRPSTGEWLLDYNGNGTFDSGDRTFHFGGQAGDLPVTGDWTGTGQTKIGIYHPATGEWLLDQDGDGTFNPVHDKRYRFGGEPGDVPVTGDWTGSGITRVGIVRRSYLWTLDAPAPIRFSLGGIPGDIPVAGDWNGDGRTKPGVFRRSSSWVLDIDGNYKIDGSIRDTVIPFGAPGDTPVAGVW